MFTNYRVITTTTSLPHYSLTLISWLVHCYSRKDLRKKRRQTEWKHLTRTVTIMILMARNLKVTNIIIIIMATNSAWKSSLGTAKKPRLNRTQTAQDWKFP